jgi:hypothetical protein
MNWSRSFDNPIPMPDGSTIRTIGEAARYATKLEKKIAQTEPWQDAVNNLMMAARLLLSCKAERLITPMCPPDRHAFPREAQQFAPQVREPRPR